MMAQKTYAWINARGTVGQVITTDADLSTLYAPDFVAACVDVTAVTPQPADHWTATKSAAGVWSFAAPVAATVSLAQQATAAQSWISQQASLATAMGETFTADMKAYVLAIAAIANGTDTTSTALPAQPTDVMTASTATTTT
ncbi:hypothetical protein [Komagataeibacter xylinus]|uniref:hypothetical protein n=1 Tax=Komagataeibacter xylinus TaxID=28448 RepID=UPI001F5EDEFA|nr:hypothetical protein [Komagataeibacter xylinus]